MAESVAARYQIRLKDQQGEVVALFDNPQNFEFQEIVNDVGYYSIFFADDGDERFDLFELDGQIEIWRTVPGVGLDWYKEYEGLHRKKQRVTEQGGAKTFQSYGVGYNDFLARTTIAYKGGTIRADKNDASETVMKEYVNENCGPLASTATAVGRLRDGVLPNFFIQRDSGAGEIWTGSRPFENLLDVLKDIANYSSIDFAVIGTASARFSFMTFVDQLGADRTTVGLSGGINGAGNEPVIFSVEYGNVQEIEYILDRTKEINVVFVLGEGEASTRDVITRSQDDTADDSPWNRREIARPTHVAQIPGLTEEEAALLVTYSMEQTGDDLLKDLQAIENFNFSPLQQPSTLYGLHYFLGDRVTVKYGDIEENKRITSVRINVRDGKENIELELATIPKAV
jgi:hypothetical protein